MKHLFLFLLAVTLGSTTHAQIAFNTGSVEFDADLNIINTNANADISAFKSDMSISFGVSIGTVESMLSMNMVPGEVYLALEIGSVTRKPVEDVLVVYRTHKGKGWGVIAQELGIKPGSDEFHALKGKCKAKKDKGNKGNGNGKGKNK